MAPPFVHKGRIQLAVLEPIIWGDGSTICIAGDERWVRGNDNIIPGLEGWGVCCRVSIFQNLFYKMSLQMWKDFHLKINSKCFCHSQNFVCWTKLCYVTKISKCKIVFLLQLLDLHMPLRLWGTNLVLFLLTVKRKKNCCTYIKN